MISYTTYDYLKLKHFFGLAINGLREESAKYILNSKSDYHKHDKLFKDILSNKKEIVKLVNKYIMPEKKITEEEIEKYDTRYVTREYEEKEADIVYKIKDKEGYFLMEHQTKVDELMAYRILEYSLEIIRTRLRKTIIEKGERKIARVIPIVIYTGQAEWKAKKEVEEIQVEFEHLKGIDVMTGYNLVDIRNEEEAIKEGTAVARMSVIERKKNTEEIIKVIEKMSKYIQEKEERKEFAKEVKYLLGDRLTKEESKKIEEILIGKKGDEGMLHAQMVLRRDAERIRKEGKKEGIISIAKKMLKENFDMDLISKLTGLKKEQILK